MEMTQWLVTPPTQIRHFHPRDAGALAQLLHESVRQLGIKGYSQAQVQAWSPSPVSARQFHERVSDGRKVLIAVSPDDAPQGFIELCSNGHIDCFYCHPHSAGMGVGTALYATLESIARNEGMPVLTVDASETARQFFLNQGFICIQRQDFRRNDVLIHNYRMEKKLV
ncbi:MAG: GNAT family N-acetyltransferase [Castellaniella sp.]|uniref:GNAT family N-acetyltransferase n=1 Tax=Castellaniella sp. TaxID=1955812 RepID=UPI003C73636B